MVLNDSCAQITGLVHSTISADLIHAAISDALSLRGAAQQASVHTLTHTKAWAFSVEHHRIPPLWAIVHAFNTVTDAQRAPFPPDASWGYVIRVDPHDDHTVLHVVFGCA